MNKRAFVFVTAATALFLLAISDQPRELGEVEWGRDLDAAIAAAAADSAAPATSAGRPIFLLFQEIPGCQTCVSFGEEVLSHPLLVEAIQDAFVPVAIYNNRAGADREVLQRYDEPAWNNPVVRFLDAEGKDIIPRRDAVWSPFLVADRMIEALERSARPVPAYLRAAAAELRPLHSERATFGMFCYWSGEACLGGIDGVTASRTGTLGGHEVVELAFDPERISYADLVAEAKRRGCADRVFAHSDAQLRTAHSVFREAQRTSERLRTAGKRDQRYYLRHSKLASLDLTDRQSLHVNAALGTERDPSPWLSPRQRKQLQ